MRTHIIRDSSTTRLDGFSLEWLPPWAYEYVTPRTSLDGKNIEIQAGPAVGAIPLANGDVLWIIPRSGQRSFCRMMLVSEGLEEAVRQDIEHEAAIGFEEGSASLATLLAMPFLRRLRHIEKHSLAPARREYIDWRSSARGRIDPLQTTLAVARRAAHPVRCRYWDKTFDTPENRVLGAAAMQLFSVGEVPPEHRATAGRWADFVSQNRLTLNELRLVVSGLSRNHYTGFRAYYIPALTLARLLLSHASVAFDSNQILPSQSLLTNMPLLFERYVRRLIMDELASDGFVVEKIAGGAKAKRLFMDGTGELLPDILVSRGGNVSLIVDAKYKPGRTADADNYYQITTYLRAYNCRKGVLVLPADEKQRFSYKTRKVFWDGVELYEVRLAMFDSYNAERFLREFIRQEV